MPFTCTQTVNYLYCRASNKPFHIKLIEVVCSCPSFCFVSARNSAGHRSLSGKNLHMSIQKPQLISHNDR